jgi:hypothetical protein
MTEYLESPESDETPQLLGENGPIAVRSTELSIRVWSIDPEYVTWSSEHAVICLMADLVIASGGQLVPESRQVLTAQFDRPEDAVVAARRLQRALRAFTENPETAGFAASIAIHRPEDQGQPGTALAVPDFLWSYSAPGQILISRNLYENLLSAAGPQFQGMSSSAVHSNSEYQELFWTDAETLAAWQERVHIASQVLQSENSHEQQEIGTGGAESGLNGVRQDEFQARTFSLDGLLGRSKVWFVVGSIGLALFAVLAVFVYLNARKTHQVQQPPQTPAVKPQPIPPPDTSTVTVPGIGPEKKETVINDADSKSARTPLPPKARKASRETEPAMSEYRGLTSKQIPQLLSKAEEDAGAGNYEDARREYGIILKLQPGNARAQQGLRKLGLIEGRR